MKKQSPRIKTSSKKPVEKLDKIHADNRGMENSAAVQLALVELNNAINNKGNTAMYQRLCQVDGEVDSPDEFAQLHLESIVQIHIEMNASIINLGQLNSWSVSVSKILAINRSPIAKKVIMTDSVAGHFSR
jgi:hypothetical protein